MSEIDSSASHPPHNGQRSATDPWRHAAARRAHRTDEAADVTVDAVRRAQMEADQAHLDALLR